MPRSKESYAAAGRKGGQTTAKRHGRAHYAAAGRKGGQTTARRHGPEHMAKIGRAGHAAMVNRHFGGDLAAANQWLAQMGAWVYWKSSGLPMKYGWDGRPLFAHPGQHPAYMPEIDEDILF